MIKSVSSFFTRERPWMDSNFKDLLSIVIEKQVAQILHLLVHVALPLEALCCCLREDVKFDKVLVSGEESQTFEKLCP
jgi:hypothetical protein